MERKIGEIFEHDGEWYQCVKDDYPFNCQECCFYNGADKKCSEELTGYCSSEYRYDGEEIIFKKLEKVGEPFRFSGSLIFQKYVLPISNPAYKGDRSLFFSAPSDTFMYVKLEQNQEDMKENKMNLKPFDLEAAKLGEPVCTRNGRKARIICFDVKGANYPILTLVEECGKESTYCYDVCGKSTVHTDMDLMMLPEKHEGWVNIVKCGSDRSIGSLYPTKEDALKHIYVKDKDYIDTVRISWEE